MAKKETRGAKPLAPITLQGDVMDGDKLADRGNQLQVLAKAEAAVRQLAENIGYAGSLDVQTLWSAVEFRQRRSVEDILEMGRGLLLIKEQTAHGEFQQQCEARGIQKRTAQRFMSVALKFSKSDSVTLLKAAGTQAKVLELTILDDEDLAALDSGESVSGITLDDVERMSASQLREALRDLRADAQAKDERLGKLSDQVNKAEEKASKAARAWKKATPDDQLNTLLRELEKATGSVRLAIAAGSEEAGLCGAVVAVMNHANEHQLDVDAEVAGILSGLINDLRAVRDNDYVMVPLLMDRRLADWQQDARA